MTHIFETPKDVIDQWKRAKTFDELDVAPEFYSTYSKEIAVSSNPVKQKKDTRGCTFFEKNTDFVVAVSEMLNANLAHDLALPVAPCVLATDAPQPTMVSLGLYNNTMSVVQSAFKAFDLHRGDSEKLNSISNNERHMTLDMMRHESKDGDLHERLQPYRETLSEMLPFLLWTRINDPNLGNIIDRADVIDRKPEKGEKRSGGYFIDLEGDASLLSSSYFSEASGDPREITHEDLHLILKDWLADNKEVSDIFDADKVWQTVRKIEKLPEARIAQEIDSMKQLTANYKFMDDAEKKELTQKLDEFKDILADRRGQLADFIQKYIPEPVGHHAEIKRAPELAV